MSRSAEDVSKKVAAAKAARAALPLMSISRLAKRLKCSRHMLRYYLADRVKCAYIPPPWADLYLAAGPNLSDCNDEIAAGQLRQLIQTLEQKPTEPCSTLLSAAPETK